MPRHFPKTSAKTKAFIHVCDAANEIALALTQSTPTNNAYHQHLTRATLYLADAKHMLYPEIIDLHADPNQTNIPPELP